MHANSPSQFRDPAHRRASAPSASTTNSGIQPSVPGLGHVHDQRVDYLLDDGDRAVDLRRPHPHAGAVDGRVGAPVDDRRAAWGDLDPVAVSPYPGKVSK
jgi:hypothetical protein